MSVTLAICAIVKNEALDIAEWVAFHELVGVERFFIYDNDSTDNTAAVLARFDSVTVHHTPGTCQQFPAYQHALDAHKHDAEWIAFIDSDEFLWSPTLLPLPTLLRTRYREQQAVGACWLVYGTGNIPDRTGGLITNTYLCRCVNEHPINQHIKSIVRPELAPGLSPDPHHFPMPTVDEHLQAFDGPFAPAPSWDYLRINHYWAKSMREAREKANRTRSDNGLSDRDAAGLLSPQFNVVYDDAITAYLPLLQQRLRNVRIG